MKIVQAAVAALEAERWDDLLSLVRPEAVQTFRDGQLRLLLMSETRPSRTPEQVLEEQPWLPRAVAAYHAAEEERYVVAGLPTLLAAWGVSSFRELEGLSPENFFVRYLAASSPAEKLRQAIAASPKPPADPELAVESARKAGLGIVVLGEIREGERQAHVLYRQLHDEKPYDPDSPDGHVQVTTLDHIDGRWWLRMDDTLLNPQGWMAVYAPDRETAPEP